MNDPTKTRWNLEPRLQALREMPMLWQQDDERRKSELDKKIMQYFHVANMYAKENPAMYDAIINRLTEEIKQTDPNRRGSLGPGTGADPSQVYDPNATQDVAALYDRVLRAHHAGGFSNSATRFEPAKDKAMRNNTSVFETSQSPLYDTYYPQNFDETGRELPTGGIIKTLTDHIMSNMYPQDAQPGPG